MERNTGNQSGREHRRTGNDSVIINYLRDLGGLGTRRQVSKEGKPPADSQADELSPDAKALLEHKPTSVELEQIEPPIMGTRGEGAPPEGRELSEEEFAALSPQEKLRYFDLPESQPRFQRTQEGIAEITQTYD